MGYMVKALWGWMGGSMTAGCAVGPTVCNHRQWTTACAAVPSSSCQSAAISLNWLGLQVCLYRLLVSTPTITFILLLLSPKAGTQFTIPWRVNLGILPSQSWVNICIRVRMCGQPMHKAAYHSGCRDNTQTSIKSFKPLTSYTMASALRLHQCDKWQLIKAASKLH